MSKITKSLYFNGTNSYAITPNITLGNNFSVMCWVKTISPPSNTYIRILETKYQSNFYLGGYNNTNQFEFIMSNGTGSHESPYGTCHGGAYQLNTWQHLAVTYNGNTAKLFLNGILVAQDTFTPVGTVSLPMYICSYYGGGYNWVCYMNQLQIWNITLTDDYIKQKYNRVLSGNESGLVAYYNMDSNTSNKLVDSSINKLDGTTYNSTLVNDAPILINELFFIQDGNNLEKTDDGIQLIQSDSLSYTTTKFQTYGMTDLSKINTTIINKIANNKYKIAMLKK